MANVAILPIPTEDRKKINSWLMTMIDGDKIVRDGNTIIWYNDGDMELDRIEIKC